MPNAQRRLGDRVQDMQQTHSAIDTTLSVIINKEVNMKTINICMKSAIDARERREAIQREVYETLVGIGMVVMVLIVLGADSWIERLL